MCGCPKDHRLSNVEQAENRLTYDFAPYRNRPAISLFTMAARLRPENAKLFTVFSGEVMAEVLGHFPWEFDRILDSVIAFERLIGMSKKKIECR